MLPAFAEVKRSTAITLQCGLRSSDLFLWVNKPNKWADGLSELHHGKIRVGDAELHRGNSSSVVRAIAEFVKLSLHVCIG